MSGRLSSFNTCGANRFQSGVAKDSLYPVTLLFKIMEPVTIMHSRLAFVFISTAFALALLSNGVRLAFAQDSNAKKNTPQHQSEKGGGGADVTRGRYLVESVAMCGQCHTPRDSNGNPDRTRWLQGAPLPWTPTQPDSNWPLSAPRIGGTPPADDTGMVTLLTTGIWTSGARLRFPMPQFRMDRSDAEAVVAYLKSLTPNQ
jgi:mono/diheme cytochrome c family protein